MIVNNQNELHAIVNSFILFKFTLLVKVISLHIL
jgi:hypothetical protein